MTNLYVIARQGWTDEINDRAGTYFRDNGTFWEPEWKDHADVFESNHGSLPSLSVVLCVGGGATVTIDGDVGEASIILCTGGNAKVEVKGDIGADVRIYCGGGGASIIYHGEVHPTARLVAHGGASRVEKAKKAEPVTVLDIRLVVDPEWVGSVSPYRVVRGEAMSRPMDLDEAIEEVKHALMSEGQRKGVQVISEIRQSRR